LKIEATSRQMKLYFGLAGIDESIANWENMNRHTRFHNCR